MWNRRPTHHRTRRWCRGLRPRSTSSAWRPAGAAACYSPAAWAGTGTSGAGAHGRTAATGPHWYPSSACITDSVTISASEITGAMPTLGRHGIRCGLSLSQSPEWTYSAVARVFRSASTTSPRVQRWVENADSGHPSCIAEHDTPAVPLGISHLVISAERLRCSAPRGAIRLRGVVAAATL